MKRMLIFSVLIAFLLGAMAYATETRVMTMGEVNNIVKDEANMSLYPSTVNYYPKEFLGEFSGSNYWKAGANFLLGEYSADSTVLGAYFSTGDFQPSIVNTLVSLGIIPPTLANDIMASHRIDLFLGRNMGQVPVGFNFGYYQSSAKNEDTADVNSDELSLTRYQFGLGFSPMMKKLDIGAHLAFTTWTHKDYVGLSQDAIRDITKPKGNMMFDVNFRYWMNPIGKYTFIPHAGFTYDKQGMDLYGEDTGGNWVVGADAKNTETMFDLGLGMNYDAAQNILVVGDLGFMLDNFKSKFHFVTPDTTFEWKNNTLFLPYFHIGIDAKVFKWMDFRSGVYTRWTREKYEPKFLSFAPQLIQKYTTNESTTTTYIGAGCHWNNLVLDASINPDFLANGPYFISGDTSGPDLATRLSIKYMF